MSERPWDTDGLLELRVAAMHSLMMAEALAPLLIEGALETGWSLSGSLPPQATVTHSHIGEARSK